LKLPRRRFLHLAAGAVALPAFSRIACAQTYPARPVRVIVPAPPGGGYDTVARLMSQWLSERLGTSFVVDNRPGAGGNVGMAGELFEMTAGVDLVHVPYRGTAPALTDLIGGQVQVMFLPTVASIEYVRAGRLRALAVTTTTRLDELPDIPTVDDFVRGYEASSWYGIGAPKARRPGSSTSSTRISTPVRRSQAQGAPCRYGWWYGVVGLARRCPQAHRRGNREVGEGGQVREH